MKFLGFILTIVGLGFLLASAYLYIDHQRFMKNAKEADGEVIRIDIIEDEDGDSYMPVIKYYVGVREIIARPDVTLSPPYGKNDFKVGDKVHFRYDKDDPGKIFFMNFFENWGVAIIFGIIGIVFFPIGILIIWIIERKKKMEQWLHRSGEKILADFILVEMEHGTTKNDKHPFYILCEWTDKMTEITYRFRSKKDIWEDPTPYIPVTKKIPVLIDPKRPKKWFLVDLDFLPSSAFK